MKLSSSDRKSLIKLAGTLPKGSAERRAILAGLKVASADRKAPQGYRYAVRFDSSDYVLQSEKEAYDRGYSDGFNDFPIEPEMMGRNGGRNHPFYRDYMDGFDEGNRDARRGGGVRSAMNHPKVERAGKSGRKATMAPQEFDEKSLRLELKRLGELEYQRGGLLPRNLRERLEELSDEAAQRWGRHWWRKA